MKKITPFLMLVFLGTVMVLSTSFSPSDGYYYGGYTPVFMKKTDLAGSVKYAESPRELENPGKLYVRGDMIYIVEKYKGVHIINNADSRNPNNTAFIIAPGCINIAVRRNPANGNEYLYLDNAIDLVTIDLASKREISRIAGYFPALKSPAGDSAVYWNAPDEYVVVEWKER